MESGNSKDVCTPMSTAFFTTTSPKGKQPKCPSTDEWINKMVYVYTMGYYLALKRGTSDTCLETLC